MENQQQSHSEALSKIQSAVKEGRFSLFHLIIMLFFCRYFHYPNLVLLQLS
ncbi:conjugal transfer protein TraG [Orientia tsutsugamushi]|nr:conjugal transfer protein TraG [Orientia tsutsugamushi]